MEIDCYTCLQASTFPTVVVYVMDTSRSVNPVTFMSNMLYACSILYKAKLPFIVAMNKVCSVEHYLQLNILNLNVKTQISAITSSV